MTCKLSVKTDEGLSYVKYECKYYGVVCDGTESEKKDCPKWNQVKQS